MCACVRVCACVCVRACVRVCVCACVCVVLMVDAKDKSNVVRPPKKARGAMGGNSPSHT